MRDNQPSPEEPDRRPGGSVTLSEVGSVAPAVNAVREADLYEVEWCHRRLLTRIHRLTVEGLRREIEPVDVAAYFRFLCRHQGLVGDHRRTGTNGLFETLGLLQGLDLPALAWERDLLPVRLEKYSSQWLDEVCLTGEVGWGRLFPPSRDPDRSRPMASLTRVAPISLFLRDDLPWLTALSPPLNPESLSGPGQEVWELLQARGALFASDILAQTRLLPTQLDEVLGELITQGFVSADGFAGLRRLMAEKAANSSREGSFTRRMAVRTRHNSKGIGRWSPWRTGQPPEQRLPESTVEQWAWQLLRRWGVVFRDVMLREQNCPKWFELVGVYRRLEARGEIRGGRFIARVSGEQFALGDTVRLLRQVRNVDEGTREIVAVSAVDPLNLVGILTNHQRVISTASNRVVYFNGAPVAALQGGEILRFAELPPKLEHEILSRLELRAGMDTGW